MAGEVVKTQNNKVGFWKRVKAEFRKIIWTDRPTLIKQTIAVIIISAIICVIISIVDSVALQLMQLIL
ncbi:MAG: preprotein translocase subunit SecE [Lachnospiraceae bacterium]|nr:preprotein translocase subunit SecE [Lachnospiraceae bacterium]